MKKIFLSIVCGVALMAGCCNTSNQSTEGEQCAACEANKEEMEYVMNIPVKIRPEFVSAYLKAFEKCQAGTLLEEGCLDYVIFQSYKDSTEFHLFERWKNKAAHNFHMETPHFLVYREETRGMNERAGSRMITVYVCPCVND